LQLQKLVFLDFESARVIFFMTADANPSFFIDHHEFLLDMDRQNKTNSDSNPLHDPNEGKLTFENVPVSLRNIETVCHRTINGDPSFYPQAEYQGRIIHFCTETCLSVFLSDPDRFYAAHSKRRS
jgi:YHS domain-containing protein